MYLLFLSPVSLIWIDSVWTSSTNNWQGRGIPAFQGNYSTTFCTTCIWREPHHCSVQVSRLTLWHSWWVPQTLQSQCKLLTPFPCSSGVNRALPQVHILSHKQLSLLDSQMNPFEYCYQAVGVVQPLALPLPPTLYAQFLVDWHRWCSWQYNWGQQKLVSICTRYTQTHRQNCRAWWLLGTMQL